MDIGDLVLRALLVLECAVRYHINDRLVVEIKRKQKVYSAIEPWRFRIVSKLTVKPVMDVSVASWYIVKGTLQCIRIQELGDVG